jgi:y4mF family transcriptional regulator
MNSKTDYIINFIKENRKKLGLTQTELAAKAGVGLRFIRELEQGKETVQLSTVNQVLSLFRVRLIPGNELDCFIVYKEHFKKPAEIDVRNGPLVRGILKDCTYRDNKIYSWTVELTGKEKDERKEFILFHQDIANIKNL